MSGFTVRAVTALSLVILSAGVAPSATAQPVDDGASGPPGQTVWLCRPGAEPNPCLAPRAATIVSADGSTKVSSTGAPKKTPVDCFYVYPTVSEQPTPNADLEIDPQEIGAAVAQASRFSEVCKVYAPMYPQATLGDLGTTSSPERQQQVMTAYEGLLPAWHEYLEQYNHGRGFVIIGHSQGAVLLTKLIQDEIDHDKALRRRLVSAFIVGANVVVQSGRRAGGSFEHVPTCAKPNETGCVIAYSSYEGVPPPDSKFGRVGQGTPSITTVPTNVALDVACVDPAALSGHRKALTAYFPTTTSPAEGALEWWPPYPEPTPWVTFPGLYSAKCADQQGAQWLNVTTEQGAVAQPTVQALPNAAWGLHLSDVNLALGDLVTIAKRQAATYTK